MVSGRARRWGGIIEVEVEVEYGEQGFPDGKGGFLVPPHSVLMFDVEVME
jgi:FKBP-type peptidyl-prolyl cis-trans isomerase